MHGPSTYLKFWGDRPQPPIGLRPCLSLLWPLQVGLHPLDGVLRAAAIG